MTGPGEQASGSWAYRAGVGVAIVTSLLTIWTTIVRDDGGGMSFFLLILAVAVGSFAAWFQAAGMARTMLGVAVMQALLGLAYATAPSTANLPGGPSWALAFNLVFAGLWLVSAACFHAAAKGRTAIAVPGIG